MSSDIKQYLTAKETWIRGLYILLFALIYSVAEIVLFAIVLFQFLSMLLSGESNNRLLNFGQSLSTYIYQILQFMTANSEEHPYPFNPWPDGPPTHSKRPQIQTTPANTSDMEDDNNDAH
jgi:hypothetical protein